MKHFLILILIIPASIFAQQYRTNFCDKDLLNENELEKCKGDLAWQYDLTIKINYIIDLKTEILPKYRKLRKAISENKELDFKIKALKRIYDSVVIVKINKYENDAESNSLYIQPNSYLSTLLSLQLFKFYPDVYAVLINPIHQSLNPKTNTLEIQKYDDLAKDICGLIKKNDFTELSSIVKNLRKDKSRISGDYQFELLQGVIDENLRTKYDIVNFLIWQE